MEREREDREAGRTGRRENEFFSPRPPRLPVLLLRLASAVVFRLPGRTARKLAGFALAEQGSLLTLRLAAARTPDLRRRALYLRHAADEARHARMFLACARARARRAGLPAPLGLGAADAEDLFARLGEAGMLAFLHHAERRGRERFELYRDLFARRGDRGLAALFTALIPDERRHEDYTWQELLALSGGDPRRARAAVRRARALEAWRAFRRAGRRIAADLYAALALVLYAALAPLAWLTRRLRPARPGLARLDTREPRS